MSIRYFVIVFHTCKCSSRNTCNNSSLPPGNTWRQWFKPPQLHYMEKHDTIQAAVQGLWYRFRRKLASGNYSDLDSDRRQDRRWSLLIFFQSRKKQSWQKMSSSEEKEGRRSLPQWRGWRKRRFRWWPLFQVLTTSRLQRKKRLSSCYCQLVVASRLRLRLLPNVLAAWNEASLIVARLCSISFLRLVGCGGGCVSLVGRQCSRERSGGLIEASVEEHNVVNGHTWLTLVRRHQNSNTNGADRGFRPRVKEIVKLPICKCEWNSIRKIR